jgi:hypothetical protein|eukprot:SAG25_NODE_561_length_6910_cov_4.942887_2_plen_84_part_00
MVKLAKQYNDSVQDEKDVEPEKLAVMNVGKVNAKRRLGESVEDLMACNITQTLGTMLDTVVFKQTNEQEGGAVEADDDAMETS